MFDIGWSELLLIAAVTIIVVGPKELPGLLRTIGQMVRRVRQMSSDFRSQLDEALQEDELQKLKKEIEDLKRDNPMTDLKDSIEGQFEAVRKDIEPDISVTGSEKASDIRDTTEETAAVTEETGQNVVELKSDVTPRHAVNGAMENGKTREA